MEAVEDDPYLKLLRGHLDDRELFDGTPGQTEARHRQLLLPYLDFFLRHDRDHYYRRLFSRKGFTGPDGELRDDLQVGDLARLRIHSDDLRGDGQAARLVDGFEPDARRFMSSGTTSSPQGPIQVARSPVTFDLAARAIAGQMSWMVGPDFKWSMAMIQAAEEMKNSMALPSLAAASFDLNGAEVLMGARLRDDPDEPSLWRRIEPDPEAMGRFFSTPAPGRIWLATPAGLGALVTEQRHIDLGEDGVLMTGGGLKRLPQFTSMSELFEAVAPLVRGRFADVLGLTESTTVFGSRADQVGSPRFWVKCPHPLTYVGYFESPQKLELSRDIDEPRLLFYVNFTCVDYLEAIVPGDIVRPQETPDYPQHGFVYERRADDGEGFSIREGCG
jgi:hypothetical protein